MNFSISPVKLPWDCYTVKSVTYFPVALKTDMNFMLRKGHFNFLFKFPNCELYLLFIKDDEVIALENMDFLRTMWFLRTNRCNKIFPIFS